MFSSYLFSFYHHLSDSVPSISLSIYLFTYFSFYIFFLLSINVSFCRSMYLPVFCKHVYIACKYIDVCMYEYKVCFHLFVLAFHFHFRHFISFSTVCLLRPLLLYLSIFNFFFNQPLPFLFSSSLS